MKASNSYVDNRIDHHQQQRLDDLRRNSRRLGLRDRMRNRFHEQQEEAAAGVGQLPQPFAFCDVNGDEQLMLAIRCQDGVEKLVCASPAAMSGGGTDTRSCYNPNRFWSNRIVCKDHDGFDQVLPYYSGCYPKDLSFWESYAPDANITSGHIDLLEERNSNHNNNNNGNVLHIADICSVDLNVPPLNLPNGDFEDR